MANTLRIKRRLAGGAAGAPSSLAAAELAYNEQDDTLYYGKGNSGGAATTIIPIAGSGAFELKAGAWSTWSPTVSSSGGTITSSTVHVARYMTAGKTVTAFVHVTITNAGTGLGNLNISLPVAEQPHGSGFGSGGIFGREIALTGSMIAGLVGSGVAVVVKYDGTTVIATNAQIVGTIVYEST